MSNLKNMDSVEDLVVSSTVLGKILNLSERRIRQLAELGTFEKIKRGQYKLVDNIQKYIIFLKTNSEANEIENKSELDYEKEKALHERVKREQDELRLAAMKGSMHKSEDVERVMNDMLSNFRSKLLGLPSKVAPMLLARNEIGEIQDLIQKEVLETLQELAAYDPATFYNEDYIEFDEEIDSELEIEKSGEDFAEEENYTDKNTE